MTAAARPPGPDDDRDDLRDRLARRIWGCLVAAPDEGITDPNRIAHAAAGICLPVVAAHTRRAQAEALRAAADDYRAGDALGDGEKYLRDRAAALEADRGEF